MSNRVRGVRRVHIVVMGDGGGRERRTKAVVPRVHASGGAGVRHLVAAATTTKHATHTNTSAANPYRSCASLASRHADRQLRRISSTAEPPSGGVPPRQRLIYSADRGSFLGRQRLVARSIKARCSADKSSLLGRQKLVARPTKARYSVDKGSLPGRQRSRQRHDDRRYRVCRTRRAVLNPRYRSR